MKKAKSTSKQPVQLPLPIDGCRKCGQADTEYRDGYCQKCSREMVQQAIKHMSG